MFSLGVVWERFIRSIYRKITCTTVECVTSYDFDFAPLMAEIKQILNNYPITNVVIDPTNLLALTVNIPPTGF